MSDDQEKSHEPTEKKLQDARRKGDVPVAAEARHAVMFAGALVVTGGLGLSCLAALADICRTWWGGADRFRFEPSGGVHMASSILAPSLRAVGPLLAVLFVFSLAILFVQGRPTLSWSRLALKWSKLSPASGLSRLFGVRALVEFAKTFAKLLAVLCLAFVAVKPRLSGLDQLVGADVFAIGQAGGAIVRDILRSVAMLVGVLAVADLVWQRRSFLRRMRMSLQELRDEMKESEGDPHIKARIRSLRITRSRRRMMSAVPTATLVITNPTHFAVALRYEHGVMAAPVVVAKGVDAVAFRIRQVATDAAVPIVENPPLARALFAAAEIDHPIPVEHYAAVAEVIGFVMRMNRKAL